MTRNGQSESLKSRKDTRICRFAALAASLSAAAIVGYAVLKPAPVTVQAHHSTPEHKIAMVAVEQPNVNETKIEAEKSQMAEESKVDESQAAFDSQQANPASPAVEASIQEEQPQMVEPEKPVEQTETVEPIVPVALDTPQTESQPSQTEAVQVVEEGYSEFEEVAPVVSPAAPAAPIAPAAPKDDGIWHISYVPAWGAASAPEDGSIGIWADGWFIAHSHMPNGDKIASLPQYVEVDGQVYEMRDTWISTDHVDTDAIARARANNGIVFQTCITDETNRMVHYEPVNGAGYAYEFTSFPYTTTDAVLFGF